MFNIFLVLIMIVAFLLIVVIMVQNPKGGGLGAGFGGETQQIGGVQKTTDFLDKSTWWLGALMIVLILLSNVTIFGNQGASSKALDGANDQQIEVPVSTTDDAPASTVPTTDKKEGE
ncbi:MAG: preprotein translocase subunit SecG [Flavobacteriaceae bacterium]|nr:preprotein translocase subunit SecG [Flavobacteriaceae bacterium]